MDGVGRRGDALEPLSAAQRRVWFLQRLDPASTAYHECGLWRIDGPVDVAALRAALDAVAARQPMLRTRFPVVDGTPRQHVEPRPATAFECVAIPSSETEPERWLADAVREGVQRPFDLAAAPPARWTLFVLGPERYALVRVWHHILGDGLSGQVINDDLARAYAACVAGQSPVLPPLAVDYAAFTRDQDRDATGPVSAAHLAYWKERLADLPTLALPTDVRRPPVQSSRGGAVVTRIDPATADAMRSFARETSVTRFAAFLTAYAALLSRLSGDSDFAIGFAVAGRPRPDYDEVVGFFANTVACRIDLSGTPGGVDAVRRVQQRVLEAVEHQYVPFETLVNALGGARDPSRNPLFQVAFGMRRMELGDLALAGANVRRVHVPLGHARFDLTLTLIEVDDGLEAHWNYCADLFERATVERMARQYAVLVEAIAREPRRPLATLPLMDDATRTRILGGSRGPATAAPGDATVHRRFAAQAALRPDARAVAQLTYAQLDAGANRLAAELRERGAGPGRIVAVARERASDVAVAWLAVLKAGAAYLPVDPELPDERLGRMLEDARVAHAIADERVAARIERAGIDVVRPDRDASRIAKRAATVPSDATGGEDPAYVIHTSGSSGRPKGVVVPHRAIVGLVCGADYAPIAPGDVVAQLAPPAFDASTFEFWGPLLNGATMVPIAKATALSPRALAATIAREGVTVMFLTTALFDAVVREVPDAFRSCGTVLFGGEAADPRRVADAIRAGPPGRLVHVYGPTETTTFATWHEVRSVDGGATTIPIGKAIAHAEAFVLRDDGQPCAPGEPGEIVIGGTGVALGYLGGSDADARRFVVAPVGDLAPRPLYRSGDRARLRDDGAIEFLGRHDRQVKVRGHRIELEEVEAALARLPEVRDAVAVVRGDTSDTRRIVAFVVPADPSAAPPDGIRRALRRVLPVSMLPAETVWVPALPLNASGKVDRGSLPSVGGSKAASAGVRIPPRDPLETDLARQWEAALGVRDIGVFDHFFDLGGHSLLAARMVDDYERETGIHIPLTALFVDDTIAGVARAIRRGSLSANAAVVPLNEDGSRPPFVYVHGDFFGGGFHSHALARRLGSDQPVYVVHPHGLAGGAVPATIEAMAEERLHALRALLPHGPYVIGGHCNGAFVAFELARRLREDGEAVPAVIVVDAAAPSEASAAASADPRATAALAAAAGIPPPTDRVSDLANSLFRAMRGYRGGRADVHLVIVRSEESDAATHDGAWSALASSVERHVLPGDHTTLVLSGEGERFAAVIRDVIDRAIARERA